MRTTSCTTSSKIQAESFEECAGVVYVVLSAVLALVIRLKIKNPSVRQVLLRFPMSTKRQKPSSGDDLSTESEDSSVSRRSGSGHRKKRLASSIAVPVVAVPVYEGSETMNANSSSTSEEKIRKPALADVLFGRGKPYQGHPGNIRLHTVVDTNRLRYVKARRYDKFAIAEDIVRHIQAPPERGRFLKRFEGEDYWEEVSDAVAREKVSHALRGKPRNENFASSGGQHANEEFVGGAAISRASVYPYGRPRSGALPGVIPGMPHSLAGGSMAAYTNSQPVPMIPSNAASLPYYPPGVGLMPAPSAGLLAGLPAHPAAFHRAPPNILAQGQRSNFNGMPIEMLSDEQLIQAMLQRRQRENAVYGGFPPHYY